MDNVPSDSLNHSFKRFRTSETQEISHASPISLSPKRKVAQSNMPVMNGSSGESINSSIDGTPVILCNDVDQFSLIASGNVNSFELTTTYQCMKESHDSNNDSSNSELLTTITGGANENICVWDDTELSDQEIISCLHSKKSSMYLSDGDVLQCLARTQACTIQDRSTLKTS